MQIRPTRWQYAAFSIIAALALAVSFLVPAQVASARSSHAHGKANAKACARIKPAGTIKYSDWQFPDTLNFYQTQASVSQETIDSLVDPLVVLNNKGVYVPEMLKSMPKASNGGKTWTAELRHGMRWSDGSEILARDVVFGFKVSMDPASGPWCSGTCDAIGRIDARGKYGLVFHLKQVYAAFIAGALGGSNYLLVWPYKWKTAWAANDVKAAVNKLFTDQTFNFENGTDYPTNGPYQISSFTQNDRIVLKPMKYYSTKSCGARLSSLIFVFYSSKPGLLAAAGNGETDATTNYTLADVPSLKAKSKIQTFVVPAYQIEHLVLNTQPQFRGNPNPLSNVKVRQALALAFDKIGSIQSALGASRKVALGILPWSPLIITKSLVQPFANTKLQGQYDPLDHKYYINTGKGKPLADAKKLLAQAGHPGGGFTVEGVTTSGNPVRQAEFAVIAHSWAQIGVTFAPDFIPSSKLFADFQHGSPLHTGDFQVAMFTDVGSPDPDAFKLEFESRFIDRELAVHAAPFANDGAIHDAKIDQDFEKAAHTLSSKLRAQYYSDWQVRTNQLAYWIPMYYRFEIATHDGKIKNFSTNPGNPGSEWNSWAWGLK